MALDRRRRALEDVVADELPDEPRAPAEVLHDIPGEPEGDSHEGGGSDFASRASLQERKPQRQQGQRVLRQAPQRQAHPAENAAARLQEVDARQHGEHQAGIGHALPRVVDPVRIGGEEERRKHARPWGLRGACREQAGDDDAPQAERDGPEPDRELVFAEDSEKRGGEPVVEWGLVEIRLAAAVRREPVSGDPDFARAFGRQRLVPELEAAAAEVPEVQRQRDHPHPRRHANRGTF